MWYEFDVVARVISVLKRQGVPADSVALEEAKVLTLAVIMDHIRTFDDTAEQTRHRVNPVLQISGAEQPRSSSRLAKRRR